MGSNERVQTQQNTEIPERKSVIKIGIQRTLSTAAFETVVIHHEIEEEISWANNTSGFKTRQDKIENWKKILIDDFKKIHDDVLEELDLSHKRAYFKKSNRQPVQTNNEEPIHNDEPSEDIDLLDSLG